MVVSQWDAPTLLGFPPPPRALSSGTFPTPRAAILLFSWDSCLAPWPPRSRKVLPFAFLDPAPFLTAPGLNPGPWVSCWASLGPTFLICGKKAALGSLGQFRDPEPGGQACPLVSNGRIYITQLN